MDFAFYGRVSTEDQQDPKASRGWQLFLSRALIEPVGGRIVTEFFDVGSSRSLPWKRRPQAARLLAALRDPNRGFDAVVIGEPQRAFYGNQFGFTFPLFEHYNVTLWIPEVGGPIDPYSAVHDLVMNLYGGMSKGERHRTSIRIRSAMAVQAATEGRYLGGPPPYGYRLADAGPHPNRAKAADGRRLRRLEPDPVTAPVVQRIYRDCLSGHSLLTIIRALSADCVPRPTAGARDPHTQGASVAWSRNSVRHILRNPRYTGRQVWNRRRRDEVLVDVDDIALGHETKFRRNDPTSWAWSGQVVHEPLVSDDDFAKAQALLDRRRGSPSRPKPTRHTYQLSGLMFCGICHHRMTGSRKNGRPEYHCTYYLERGSAKPAEHPHRVRLPEDTIVPALDRWLLRAFLPTALPHTARTIAAAQDDELDIELLDSAIQARRTIAACDERLARYRAALEAGTDPALIAAWTADVNTTRADAQARLDAASDSGRSRRTPDQISTIVTALGSMLDVLRDGDSADKAMVYKGLGLRLTYHPGDRTVVAETQGTDAHQ